MAAASVMSSPGRQAAQSLQAELRPRVWRPFLEPVPGVSPSTTAHHTAMQVTLNPEGKRSSHGLPHARSRRSVTKYTATQATEQTFR